MDYSKLDENSQIEYLNRLDEAFAIVQDVVNEPPESKVNQLIKFMKAYREEWNNLHLFDKSYIKHLNNIISIAQQCQDIRMLNSVKDSQNVAIVNPDLILCIVKDIFMVPQLLEADTIRGCFTQSQYNEIIKVLTPTGTKYK